MQSASVAAHRDDSDKAIVASLVDRVPLPKALRSTVVFLSSTDQVQGSGFQITVAATPKWTTITSAQHLDGVGLAITRIMFDDGDRQIQYNVSESNATVLPGRYREPAPVGNGFQATPLAWMRLLEAIASEELAATVTRLDGTVTIQSGAYAIYIDEQTAEIRRVDTSGSGFVTTMTYSDWLPVPADIDQVGNHPTRLTMSMTADGVERARREFAIAQIEVLPVDTQPVPPTFTSSTLVRDHVSNTNYMGSGEPVELGAPVKQSGTGPRSQSIAIAALGVAMLLLAAIVVAKRRGG